MGGGGGGEGGVWGDGSFPLLPSAPPHHSPGVLPDEGFLLGALPPLRRALTATPDPLLPIPAEFWGLPPPPTPVPSVPPLPSAAPHRAGGGGKGGGWGGEGDQSFPLHFPSEKINQNL